MSKLSRVPFHTFLLAGYPVLAMLAANINEVSGFVAWRPLLISLAGATLLQSLLGLIIRDWPKAALITSIFLLVFFTYGHIYNALKTTVLVDFNVVRHRYLLSLFLVFFGLISWFIIRKFQRKTPATIIFNAISLVLVIIPVSQIVLNSIITSREVKTDSEWTPTSLPTPMSQSSKQPDVYYIILDSYTRSDVLQSELEFDNSEFIRELEDKGFYVAECSMSNYNDTSMSLASSLNISYLPELYAKAVRQGISKEDIWMYIKPSLVRRTFESLGYKIVTFDTGYLWTTIKDSDLYLQRGEKAYGVQFINPFEQMLIDSTLLSIYSDFQSRGNIDKYYGAPHPYANYIGQQEFILDQLPKIKKIADPTFTIAHISVQHRPFVFSPKGYLIDPALMPGNDPMEVLFPIGYLYATEFLNERVITIINELQVDTTTPPIIILQGDHGYLESDQYISPILNAYYLPGVQAGILYPTISPVNSFRIIFDQYFGGAYELLPDVSFQKTNVNMPITDPYPDCVQ